MQKLPELLATLQDANQQESWAVQQARLTGVALAQALAHPDVQDGSLRHCPTNIVIGEGGLRDPRCMSACSGQ